MIHTVEDKLKLDSIKLHQVGAEMSFPSFFAFVPWRHHVEIVSKCNSVEEALEQSITRFLLELGTGFAFIGRQKGIVVSGKTRKIDMLFYHIRLKCYVVVELKAVSFEPEFAGKLNFYVKAVNELIRTPDENPTIGLLICKDKDQTEVQWAFQGIQTPMGVASYDNVRLEEIKKQLPTEKEIQQRIELAEEEFILNRKKKK